MEDGRAYLVLVQGIDPQHIERVPLPRPVHPPLLHLIAAQIMRRIHVAQLPLPQHLLLQSVRPSHLLVIFHGALFGLVLGGLVGRFAAERVPF